MDEETFFLFYNQIKSINMYSSHTKNRIKIFESGGYLVGENIFKIIVNSINCDTIIGTPNNCQRKKYNSSKC